MRMSRRQHQLMRTAFFLLLFLSVAAAASKPAADAEPTPAPEAAAADAAAGATEAAAEELPPLDCKPGELLEKIDTWSIDCVAMWLENLGFPELRLPFMGNKMDGASLKQLTMSKLADDYGVSDEEQRKKIYYNLKDVLRKDTSTGNTNHYSQMLFWCLPFLGIYKWITLKYDKQIARAMKRYKKWQEVSCFLYTSASSRDPRASLHPHTPLLTLALCCDPRRRVTHRSPLRPSCTRTVRTSGSRGSTATWASPRRRRARRRRRRPMPRRRPRRSSERRDIRELSLRADLSGPTWARGRRRCNICVGEAIEGEAPCCAARPKGGSHVAPVSCVKRLHSHTPPRSVECGARIV